MDRAELKALKKRIKKKMHKIDKDVAGLNQLLHLLTINTKEKTVTLDEAYKAVLKMFPNAIIDTESDGNIVFVTMMRLADDDSTLVPLPEDIDLAGEED